MVECKKTIHKSKKWSVGETYDHWFSLFFYRRARIVAAKMKEDKRRKENIAAGIIQSCWRLYKRTKLMTKAVIKIQTCWRKYRLTSSRVCTCIYRQVHMYMYVCTMYIYMYVCTVYMYMYICSVMYMYVCMYIYIHVYMYGLCM